jgi:hypothetical protein
MGQPPRIKQSPVATMPRCRELPHSLGLRPDRTPHVRGRRPASSCSFATATLRALARVVRVARLRLTCRPRSMIENPKKRCACFGGVSIGGRLKSHVARPCHFKPAAMRCVDRPHDNAIALGTSKNRSHRSRIQMQRSNGSGRAACLALNLRGRYFKNEDLLKETCGRIAIQNEVCAILSHGVYPSEGPKRSVLIA